MVASLCKLICSIAILTFSSLKRIQVKLVIIKRTKFNVIITNNPKPVEDYKNGKEQALQALVGQVMAKTKGKANGGLVLNMLKDKLK